jgi:hypothetical protein
LWTAEDDAFLDHVSMITHPKRILVSSCEGELLLVSTRGDEYQLLGRMKAFDGQSEMMSHPALVGTRLYLRDGTHLVCLDLKEQQ